jgi:hypothetical protein
MTSFKGTNGKPTSSCDVRRRRNMGLPAGREPHGNGVPVVVRGWESQPHGEGEQRMDTQSLEGARDAQSRQATQRGTGEPSREPFLESRMTRKRSCPVRRGGIGKVPEQSGNSLVPYSTSRPVLRGGGGRKTTSLPDSRFKVVARGIGTGRRAIRAVIAADFKCKDVKASDAQST